jgi:hypothetical protein
MKNKYVVGGLVGAAATAALALLLSRGPSAQSIRIYREIGRPDVLVTRKLGPDKLSVSLDEDVFIDAEKYLGYLRSSVNPDDVRKAPIMKSYLESIRERDSMRKPKPLYPFLDFD